MARFLLPVLALIACAIWGFFDLSAQKLFARLLLPAGLCWVGLLGLAIAAWKAAAFRLALAASSLWILYSLAGNVWVGNLLFNRLEALVPASEARAWPAVALLGGGTESAPDGSPELGRCGDRLRVAAGLWQAHQTPLIIASSSAAFDLSRDVPGETATLLASWGVPDQAILRLPGPRTTAEEIVALKRLAGERGWERIAVVTSAWHLPRALALCRKQGLAADGIAADRRGRPITFSIHLIVPCGQGFESVQTAGLEMLGRLIGR